MKPIVSFQNVCIVFGDGEKRALEMMDQNKSLSLIHI